MTFTEILDARLEFEQNSGREAVRGYMNGTDVLALFRHLGEDFKMPFDGEWFGQALGVDAWYRDDTVPVGEVRFSTERF